jgi:uncharacterized membrane protein
MQWVGVAGGVVVAVFVMLAVWRLVRKLEGDKPNPRVNR